MQIIVPFKKDCDTRLYNLVECLKRASKTYNIILVAQLNNNIELEHEFFRLQKEYETSQDTKLVPKILMLQGQIQSWYQAQIVEITKPLEEIDFKVGKKILFEMFPDGNFIKNRLINIGISQSDDKFLTILDCDCYLNMRALQKANKLLRSGAYSFIFPHNGIMRNILKDGTKEILYDNCIGGAISYDKLIFIEKCGAENENFIAWGFEDGERYQRLIKLGYKIHKLPYEINHLNHERGLDSCEKNPNLAENRKEFYKVKLMDDAQIQSYAEELRQDYYSKYVKPNIKDKIINSLVILATIGILFAQHLHF